MDLDFCNVRLLFSFSPHVAGEVLNAVTYMYMFPEDERSLLPQPDEVLLCTENTTFEQVGPVTPFTSGIKCSLLYNNNMDSSDWLNMQVCLIFCLLYFMK